MKLIYTTLSALLLLTACAGEEPSDEASEGNSVSTESASENDALDEEVNESLTGLTLNNGSKWKVDISTDEGMNRVQELVDNFDGEDAKELGKEIKETLKDVTKNCNMSGEDHNQYHILLEAMLDEAKQLKKEKSTDPAKMQRYLDAYEKHFEAGETE